MRGSADPASVEKARLNVVLEQLSGVRIEYLEDLKAGFGMWNRVCVLWHALFPKMAIVAQDPQDAAVVLFVVPLNALLQEKGHTSIGAGRAIAVQNLAENSMMLVMVGVYMLILREEASITAVASGFGIVLAVAIAGLALVRGRRRVVSRALG